MAIDVRLGKQLEALPVHSPEVYSRVSLDPRLAREFLEFSSVAPETRAELSQHIITSKWTPSERAVYGAVIDGFTSVEELGTVTGLATPEIQSTVGKLEKKGVLRRITNGKN